MQGVRAGRDVRALPQDVHPGGNYQRREGQQLYWYQVRLHRVRLFDTSLITSFYSLIQDTRLFFNFRETC